MTRKLHVQLPGAFLRCIINSAVQHLRTVQHNYSVVRVLCTVLVHCTVRTVQCTRISYYTNRVRPCHPICRLALLPVIFFVQLYSTVYRYTVQTRTVHLSILRCTGK